MAPVLTSPLVSTQWLADHLGADDLVIVDASVRTSGTGLDTRWASARDDHEHVGHIPGAVYADLIETLSDPAAELPFARPSVERFESAIARLGISNDSTVVVYDDASGQWSARLWWLFRSFGFDGAAVLDGGFTKWRAEERAIRAGALTVQSALSVQSGSSAFLATEEHPLWVDRDRVERAVSGDEPAALVLAADETDLGQEHPPVVPGSTTIPMRELLDVDTNAFRKPKALESVFEPVLDADEIVAYCGVGNAACVDALALTLLGHDRVRVYDGSLADWWREPQPA
jgi:thiosulfate/3-mercaptopyruvate sulfurtransferase